MPAIAVVMPVYNRAQGVGDAIESVLAQDFADFELIVVDDGSRDGTADVVEAFPDPRVRCLRQPRNQGGNAARNRGIREADSPLICFIDSDDLFLPRKLGFLNDYFARNPETEVLLDSFRQLYPPGSAKSPGDRINPELAGSAEVEEAVFARRLYKATPAITAKRAALLAVGLFDETLKRRQDMDLILRLTRNARCAATSEVLWTKCWSADSISAKKETFLTAMIEMCERHPDYLHNPDFRVGLALDLARHFLRLLRKGRFGPLGIDIRRCIGFFGLPLTARLLGAGLVETLRRNVARRST